MSAMRLLTSPLELLLVASLIGCSTGISADMPMQANSAARFGNKLAIGLAALTDTVADTEMGDDLELNLAVNKPLSFSVRRQKKSAGSDDHVDEDGPATLAEYCAGDTQQEHKQKLKKGKKVMADWEQYGTMYPGRIEKKNPDGTVDIHYDDGFHEKGVKAHHVKPVEEEEDEVEKKDTQNAKPKQRNDPACKMQDFLKKTKEKLGKLDPMISQWLAAQRAKLAKTRSDNLPEPPQANPVIAGDHKISAAPPSAAPPAAPGPAAATDEIEELKVQLADRDAYIEKLKKQKEENLQELHKYLPATTVAPPPGMKAIDDLIAGYKGKIAERDRRSSNC